jgi:hypothetical protein
MGGLGGFQKRLALLVVETKQRIYKVMIIIAYFSSLGLLGLDATGTICYRTNNERAGLGVAARQERETDFCGPLRDRIDDEHDGQKDC